METPNDIYNEITRIDNAKQGIAEAIEEKGVQVPDGTPIQDFPAKVRQIQTGSPDAVLYTPQELTPEQQGQARQNIGAGTYTKPGTGIPSSDLAEPVQTSLGKADTALQPAALTPITELIPEQATPQNQLADKNFVNSSVATNTANYISDNGQPFQSVADLEAYSGTLTNNDYAFVVGTDSAGNTTYTRYKYNANTEQWAEEYVLNNSSFTAEQWAAISSGITALLVSKLQGLPDSVEANPTVPSGTTPTELQNLKVGNQYFFTPRPEIFLATYGTTTAAEIEAAIQANKLPICFYNSRIYVYSTKALGSQTYNNLIFVAPVNNRIYQIAVRSDNNVWSATLYDLQNTDNKTADIPTNRTSTTKYPNTKGVFDLVGKWGVVSQTQTWTGSDDTGYDYTMSDLVWGIIPNEDIEKFKSTGYNTVATFNEATGYFELNGLTDISYMEMVEIYKYSALINLLSWSGGYAFRNNKSLRTIPYLSNGSAINFQYSFSGAEKLELIKSAFYASSFVSTFQNCYHLREITGMSVQYVSAASASAFQNCYCLEKVQLRGLKVNLSLNNSPRVSLESVVFIVVNAQNTTAITITLHATAYARMQADTTEYTYNGQTYTGIIAYAAAKNITIASA